MERQVSLEEISDGKLYGPNDMVKADCQDCKGCSACCQGMGSSITLDPYDVARMTEGLQRSFEELLQSNYLELNVVDGIILPNLKMNSKTEKCSFLNQEGRCTIHSVRPGICRIFPLGRFYENQSFQYFLQVHECRNTSRSKVKVKKWIDTPNQKENEAFINQWHYYLKALKQHAKSTEDDQWLKSINMYLLKSFFMTPYQQGCSFYLQFDTRIAEARKLLR